MNIYCFTACFKLFSKWVSSNHNNNNLYLKQFLIVVNVVSRRGVLSQYKTKCAETIFVCKTTIVPIYFKLDRISIPSKIHKLSYIVPFLEYKDKL